ncbi:MAG: acyltransferase family protein [Candidatus Lokiarchaeota archaeon]|nr:acyltransferase family protein [Candidatus Lokiarchaeota archaeon]MBD3200408.1 acyltransferase family protein [Candidatus Lokiarchaeota archaeon]
MKKSNQIDILRGFAIMQVLAVHVIGRSLNSNELIIQTIFGFSYIIMLCGVPLFIFISGYTLSAKYWEDFSIKKFYKNRIKNVFIPYFSFSIIYIFLKTATKSYVVVDGDFVLLQIFYILFRPDKVFYHFWYIGLIFSFYIFYPLIERILLKFKKRLFEIFILSVIIQMVWSLIYETLLKLFSSLNLDFFVYSFIFYFFKYLFLSNIAFFILGICFQKGTFKFEKPLFYIIPLFAFSFLFLVLLINFDILIGSLFPLLYIPLIILFLKISNKLSYIGSLFIKIGKHSYGIYLIHAYLNFMIFVHLISNGFTINSWYFYIVNFIITFSASYTIIRFINYMPHSNLIIGKTRIQQSLIKYFLKINEDFINSSFEISIDDELKEKTYDPLVIKPLIKV